MDSITLSIVSVRQVSGRAYIRWSDGVEQEFTSIAQAKAFAHDNIDWRDVARRMALARYLRVDPTGATPSLIEGHSITLTDENNTMATVS